MKAFDAFTPARVSVHLTQPIYFVTPRDTDADGPPTGTDAMLNGTATIHLRKATVVRQLCVELVGTADVHVEDRASTIETLRQTLRFDIFAELRAGDHSFAFDFVLPPSTAVHERSRFGRVTHKVRASIEGLGIFGSTIADEQRFLLLAVPPAAPGSSSQGQLGIDVQGFNEDLGPYRIQARSELATVGGLIEYALTLYDPPEGCAILKTDGSFRQTARIRSIDGQEYAPEPTDRRCWLVDALREPETNDPPLQVPTIHAPATIPLPEQPLHTFHNQVWSIRHRARIPPDNYLRASTSPYTDTPFRFSHELHINIVYRNAQGNERIMTLARPVQLLSCCARYASVILPAYSPDADEHQTAPNLKTRAFECICGLSARQVIDEQGGLAGIQRIDSGAIDDSPRTGLKVGEQAIAMAA